MKNTKSLLSGLIITSLISCGTQLQEETEQNQSNDKSKNKTTASEIKLDAPQASSSEIIADDELVNAEISSSIDEAIATLADEDKSASTGLRLANGASGTRSRSFEIDRSCKEVEAKAVVDIALNFSREWSVEGRVRSASHKISDIGSVQRTWSKTDAAVACDENAKHVDLENEQLPGTKLEVEFSRSKSRESNFTNLISKKSISRYSKLKTEGQRSVSIEAVDVNTEEKNYVVSKSLSSVVKRAMQVKNKDNQERLIESSLLITADSPLKIQITRDLDTDIASQKLIQSGSIVAERSDKGKMITRFENVLYKKGKGCIAESGKITGEIFTAESTTASLSFEIIFENGQAQIKFSNGKEAEYTPEGCDLETIDSMASE